MGLDVYLHRYGEDIDSLLAKREEYKKKCGELWESYGSYDTMSSQDKDAVNNQCQELAVVMGLPVDEYGDVDMPSDRVEMDSRQYPDHMYKIGYFRSSYNEGGINHVLDAAIGESLYSIFPESEENPSYILKVDWTAAKARIQDVRKRFGEYLSTMPYRVTACARHNEDGATSDAQAMEIFKQHLAKKKSDFPSYSSKEGDFYLQDPLPVVAAIPGRDVIGAKCVYLVYRDAGMQWYADALAIVEETIDYVLQQDNPEQYRFIWSG